MTRKQTAELIQFTVTAGEAVHGRNRSRTDAGIDAADWAHMSSHTDTVRLC